MSEQLHEGLEIMYWPHTKEALLTDDGSGVSWPGYDSWTLDVDFVADEPAFEKFLTTLLKMFKFKPESLERSLGGYPRYRLVRI